MSESRWGDIAVASSSSTIELQVSLWNETEEAGASVNEAKDPSIDLRAAAEHLARRALNMSFLSWEELCHYSVEVKGLRLGLLLEELVVDSNGLSERLGQGSFVLAHVHKETGLV